MSVDETRLEMVANREEHAFVVSTWYLCTYLRYMYIYTYRKQGVDLTKRLDILREADVFFYDALARRK